MQPGPDKRIEKAVAVLIPPACREHVLGDLHERYSGPWQYVFDAANTAPRVVFSKARRNANPPVLLMECAALYLAMAATGWGLAGPPYFSAQSGILRLLIPTAAAAIGLLLGGAYFKSGSPHRMWPAAAFAILSQAVLRAFSPELATPAGIIFVGVGPGLVLLQSVRFLLRPSTPDGNATATAGAAISLDEIHHRMQKLCRTARRRNLKLLGPVVFVAFLGSWAMISPRPSDRVVSGAILISALYAGFQVLRRAAIRTAPASLAFYRAELLRQSDALLRIWS